MCGGTPRQPRGVMRGPGLLGARPARPVRLRAGAAAVLRAAARPRRKAAGRNADLPESAPWPSFSVQHLADGLCDVLLLSGSLRTSSVQLVRAARVPLFRGPASHRWYERLVPALSAGVTRDDSGWQADRAHPHARAEPEHIRKGDLLAVGVRQPGELVVTATTTGQPHARFVTSKGRRRQCTARAASSPFSRRCCSWRPHLNHRWRASSG